MEPQTFAGFGLEVFFLDSLLGVHVALQEYICKGESKQMAGVVLKRPTCIGNGVNGQDPCNNQRADAKLELNYIILTNFATKLNPSNSNSSRWGSPQQFCLPTSDRMWGSPQHFVRRFVGQVLAWLDEEWSGKPLGRDWTIVSILFRFGGRCLCLGEGITSLTHRVCGFLFGFLSAKPAPKKTWRQSRKGSSEF